MIAFDTFFHKKSKYTLYRDPVKLISLNTVYKIFRRHLYKKSKKNIVFHLLFLISLSFYPFSPLSPFSPLYPLYLLPLTPLGLGYFLFTVTPLRKKKDRHSSIAFLHHTPDFTLFTLFIIPHTPYPIPLTLLTPERRYTGGTPLAVSGYGVRGTGSSLPLLTL